MATPERAMSNTYIPKERLTAYERWEVAAFDEAEQIAQSMRDAEAETAAIGAPAQDTAPVVPAEPAISAEDLAAIREEAFAEGRAEGFEEGFTTGQAEGYASGETLIKSEAAVVAALAKDFALAIEKSETELADNLLALAIDIAAQVVRTTVKVKPELIVPAVRDAIAVLANPHGHPNLMVHPDDADLIREQLGDQLSHTGWRIVEDSSVARGGCKIENGGAEIDATLATRWRRVIDALGKKSDWLDLP